MTERPDHELLAPSLPSPLTPWWEDGTTLTEGVAEPAMLATGIMGFWQRIRRAILLPLYATDALRCDEAMLDLLAWERDITRFAGEPLDVYRRRVHFAFVNAQDAGQAAGFVRIFERFGITLRQQMERIEGMDWDLVLVLLDEHTPQLQERLATALITHYRRTCRRYSVGVTASTNQQAGATHFAAGFHTQTATARIDMAGTVWANHTRAAQPVTAHYHTTEATWPKS
ncbi:phage tail protein [Aeromonas schubertii]|uniref:Phage tail protein n=1 Tax=Aeromonas schubertii TaxID=652 RepID=A0A0S2SIZ6_9GAMM|nr:hypothetical protein [Aeromonas schubertii]ALP41619.1 hypothetical protein WL1483_2200 [Aeromonas schubertii]